MSTKFSIILMHIFIWTLLASLANIMPCYFLFVLYLCLCLFAWNLSIFSTLSRFKWLLNKYSPYENNHRVIIEYLAQEHGMFSSFHQYNDAAIKTFTCSIYVSTVTSFLNHITYLSWYPSPTEKLHLSIIYWNEILLGPAQQDFRRKLQEIFISVFTMWVPSNDTNIQGGSNYVVNERRIPEVLMSQELCCQLPGHRCPSYWLLASWAPIIIPILTVRWMWSKAAGTGEIRGREGIFSRTSTAPAASLIQAMVHWP